MDCSEFVLSTQHHSVYPCSQADDVLFNASGVEREGESSVQAERTRLCRICWCALRADSSVSGFTKENEKRTEGGYLASTTVCRSDALIFRTKIDRLTSCVFFGRRLSTMLYQFLSWLLPTCSGHLLSLMGLLLEVVADHQKSDAKAANPNAPCTTGLYRLCR